MRATTSRSATIRAAAETAAGTVAPSWQSAGFRAHQGWALFSLQHDSCHRAHSEGQSWRVHKLRELYNLSVLRSAVASVANRIMNFNCFLCQWIAPRFGRAAAPYDSRNSLARCSSFLIGAESDEYTKRRRMSDQGR
jgi:hypothetical protein